MGAFRTLLGWARSVWGAIDHAASDIADVIEKLWHYITSVHDFFAWLAAVPTLDMFRGLVNFARDVGIAYTALLRMGQRTGTWIYNHWIMPWVRYLEKQLAALAAREARDVRMLVQDDIEGLRLAQAYTEKLTGIEHRLMLAAVAAEHAAMLTQLRALHQVIESEAATGYSGGQVRRLSTITGILDDIAARNPVIKTIIGTLVKDALDLAGVENPLARITIGLLIKEVTSKAGVDAAAGDLVSRLLGAAAGEGHPGTLHDVIHALDARLSAVEDQWAEFMTRGGPEVMQAGDDWKAVTGLAGDSAILATFGLAVADPTAWAAGISDTLGVLTADTIKAVSALLHHA